MSTINVNKIQHESGAGDNINLDASGNVECAGEITAAGNITSGEMTTDASKEGTRLFNAGGMLIRNDNDANVINIYSGGETSLDKTFEVTSSGSITAVGGANFDGPVSVTRVSDTQSCFEGYKSGVGSTTSKITADGSSSFKGALEVDRENGTETGVIIREDGTARGRWYANGNIVTAGALTATNGLFTEETGINWRISSSPDGAGGSSAMYIGNARIGTTTRSTIWLDPDNPDNFNDKNEYVGETLDVKEELQALRARATQQDAVIAQMVTALRSQGVTIDTTEV